MAIIVDDKKDVAAFSNFSSDQSSSTQPSPSQTTQAQETNAQQPQQTHQTQQTQQQQSTSQQVNRIFASPLAKKTANEHNVQLNSVSGTGPNNRIINQDVLEFASSRSQQPPAQPSVTTQPPQTHQTPLDQSSEWTDLELTQMRKVIAERLLFSKQSIPHFYIQADVEMDNLIR